jgi:hypothetical protein
MNVRIVDLFNSGAPDWIKFRRFMYSCWLHEFYGFAVLQVARNFALLLPPPQTPGDLLKIKTTPMLLRSIHASAWNIPQSDSKTVEQATKKGDVNKIIWSVDDSQSVVCCVVHTQPLQRICFSCFSTTTEDSYRACTT